MLGLAFFDMTITNYYEFPLFFLDDDRQVLGIPLLQEYLLCTVSLFKRFHWNDDFSIWNQDALTNGFKKYGIRARWKKEEGE